MTFNLSILSPLLLCRRISYHSAVQCGPRHYTSKAQDQVDYCKQSFGTFLKSVLGELPPAWRELIHLDQGTARASVPIRRGMRCRLSNQRCSQARSTQSKQHLTPHVSHGCTIRARDGGADNRQKAGVTCKHPGLPPQYNLGSSVLLELVSPHCYPSPSSCSCLEHPSTPQELKTYLICVLW